MPVDCSAERPPSSTTAPLQVAFERFHGEPPGSGHRVSEEEDSRHCPERWPGKLRTVTDQAGNSAAPITFLMKEMQPHRPISRQTLTERKPLCSNSGPVFLISVRFRTFSHNYCVSCSEFATVYGIQCTFDIQIICSAQLS